MKQKKIEEISLVHHIGTYINVTMNNDLKLNTSWYFLNSIK